MAKQSWPREKPWWETYNNNSTSYKNAPKIPGYGWLLRSAIAVFLFVVAYVAHGGQGLVSLYIDRTVIYALHHDVDVVYWWNKLEDYRTKQKDVAVFRQIAPTLTKRADPLQYLQPPVAGNVMVEYGWNYPLQALKETNRREGIEFEALVGAEVKAAAPGKVKAVTDSKQFGKLITVSHGNEVETIYGYVTQIAVKTEDIIGQGQVLAQVAKPLKGDAGRLYFEVRVKGKAVDPLGRMQQPVRK